MANRGRAAVLLALFVFTGLILHGQAQWQVLESKHAKDLMASGKFAEAVPIYRKLVQALPGNTGMLLNLALALHMAGQDKEAVPQLEAVLKVQPKLVPALVALGTSRLALGQPAEAVAALRKAVEIEPKNPDALGMIANALMEQKLFEEAAAEFRRLSDLAPDDPRAWFGLGSSYEAIAAGAFETLQKMDAQSPFVAVLIADTRVQRRQYKSAFFFYREAVKQLPGLHGVHAAMAEVYRKTGHSDWAVSEDAKEQALPAADCKQHAAECLFVGGHDVQALSLPAGAAPAAEALFWQAKAANELAMQSFFRLGQLPPSVELHQLRATIARNQDQHLESLKEWRAALELSPGNPRLLYEEAVSLFMARDYKAAVEHAARLLRAMPGSAELHFIAGDSFLRLEEAEKALPYLQKALALDAGLTAAHASLGLSLMRIGKGVEAVPHLEKALELDDDGSLHYQLAQAYRAAGNAEKSRLMMSKQQEIVARNKQAMEDVAREAVIAAPQ